MNPKEPQQPTNNKPVPIGRITITLMSTGKIQTKVEGLPREYHVIMNTVSRALLGFGMNFVSAAARGEINEQGKPGSILVPKPKIFKGLLRRQSSCQTALIDC